MKKIYPCKNSPNHRVFYWKVEDMYTTHRYKDWRGNVHTYRRTLWVTIGRNRLTWKDRYTQKYISSLMEKYDMKFDTEANNIYMEISDEEALTLKSIHEVPGKYWTFFRDAVEEDRFLTDDELELRLIVNQLTLEE